MFEGVASWCVEGVNLDSDIDFCGVDKGKSSPLFVWSLYVSRGCATQDVDCQGVALPAAPSFRHPGLQLSPLAEGYGGYCCCLLCLKVGSGHSSGDR
jgi:hypothetical protein